MKILFLDQSGKLGGAELSLSDVVRAFQPDCLVGLFEPGPFRDLLQNQGIAVEVLGRQALAVQKESSLWQGLQSITHLWPLVNQVVRRSRAYDVIYTNTSKALVVGAIAASITRKPLVHHLRDIVSQEHFSAANQKLMVTLLNQVATLVIANSHATRTALVQAGGKPAKIQVIYNGFAPDRYGVDEETHKQLRKELGLADKFVVGHFSRLAPWKGQHVLIKALAHAPEPVVALLVGSALFGEDDYVNDLHHLVAELNLNHRVHFLGFRSDIPELMHACDLIAHTSTAPEPFGRVIVEAMMCNRPVVAAAAGGAQELVEHGKTGWLCPPGDARKLADIINTACTEPQVTSGIAQQGQRYSQSRFDLNRTNQEIEYLLGELQNRN
jgi:glycosyltransferase involved in cell wall biosynthesis